MLEAECLAAGVQILPGVNLEGIRRTDEFIVNAGPREFRAAALVIATGGLSIPAIWSHRIRL